MHYDIKSMKYSDNHTPAPYDMNISKYLHHIHRYIMILNPYSTCNNLKIVSVCTCVYVDVGVCVYVCMHGYMYVHIYMHTYMYAYVYIYRLMVIKLNIFLKQKLCVFLCCNCNH